MIAKPGSSTVLACWRAAASCSKEPGSTLSGRRSDQGRVVPQQWLAYTTAPGGAADDRRRLDFVIYGAAAHGKALCCDATLVSPARRDGSPQAGAPERDGVAIATPQRRKLARYPVLTRNGSHGLCVLAAEVGGRWNDESQRLVQRLVSYVSVMLNVSLPDHDPWSFQGSTLWAAGGKCEGADLASRSFPMRPTNVGSSPFKWPSSDIYRARTRAGS